MLGIKKFKYAGYRNNRHTFVCKEFDKIYHPVLTYIPKKGFDKNQTYLAIIIKNKPNVGFILLGINKMSLCEYAEALLNKNIKISVYMLEIYRRIFLEDKHVSKYVYVNSNINNKLLATDKLLPEYVSRYIVSLCKNIKNNKE